MKSAVLIFTLFFILFIQPEAQSFTCHGKASTDPNVCSGNGRCASLNFCKCNNSYRGPQCELKPYENCLQYDTILVEWNLRATEVDLRVSTTFGATGGWSGVGFNNQPVMNGGAMIVGWNSTYAGSVIYEYTAPGHTITFNQKQRLKSISTQVVNKKFIQSYTRPLKDATDPNYFELKNETIYLLVGGLTGDTPMDNSSVWQHDTSSLYMINLFTPSPCNFTCFGLAASDAKVCSGNGTCDTNNVCICKNGIVGTQCQSEKYNCYGKESSDLTVCNGRGRCVGNYTCSCDIGWKGNDCSDKNAGQQSTLSLILLFILSLFFVFMK